MTLNKKEADREREKLREQIEDQIDALWAYVEAVLAEREKQQQKTQPS